uniref:Alpha-methylacyl-CoA racemase n=1 Tax=Plectus sambesii TaxID=2011161 RepID=A0A914UJ71_9BILA
MLRYKTREWLPEFTKNILRQIFVSSSKSATGRIKNQPPLRGVRVIELAGLAPAPFCGLILADFGASVTRIVKPNEDALIEDCLTRGKRTIEVDLKTQQGIETVSNLCFNADILIDPYRPGVLEKLGLGSSKLLRNNGRLIIARITGYGQTGPLAQSAGHDINYVAMSGLLPTISQNRQQPFPPANLLADFAGGGLSAAFGILLAIFEREKSNKGQVIDVSMTEGLAYLGSFVNLTRHWQSFWDRDIGVFSGNYPVYRTYKAADGKFLAVGALENKFQENLFKGLKLPITSSDVENRPEYVSDLLEKEFMQKARDEWMEIFKDCDACVSPVLEMDEVGEHHHHIFRANFTFD